MKKLLLLLLIGCATGERPQLQLMHITHLPDFPSASAIEYHHNKLYIFGDDAPSVWVVDTAHAFLDSIRLYSGTAKRLLKGSKHDIEAATLINGSHLFAVSSFSSASRNQYYFSAFPLKRVVSALPYDHVKKVLHARGINEINLEGAASVGRHVVLSNRANKTNKINQFIISEWSKMWNPGYMHMAVVDLPADHGVKGISGITYCLEKDMLIFTASTEETADALSDGTIGDSYLGYISRFSKKLSDKVVKPDMLWNINRLLALHGNNKIESVAIESVSEKEMIIHLAADNDDGSSILYKLRWRF